MLVYLNGNKPLIVKNAKIREILFKAVIQMVSGTNSIITGDFDPSKITVKVSLHRGGKMQVLQSSSLLVMWMRSAYKTGIFQSFRTAAQAWSDFAISASGLYVVPMTLDLGGWVNLHGSDKLKVEINFTSGFSTNINANASFLDVREIKGDGIEAGVPYIRIEAIENGAQRLSYDLGDHVEECMLICTDQTKDFTVASQLFTDLNIESDKVKGSFNYPDMLERRMQEWEFASQWQARGQNWMIIDEKDAVHNGKLDVNFDPANVATGQVFLVVKHFDRNPAAMQRSYHALQVKNLKSVHKLGLGDASTHAKLAEHTRKHAALHPGLNAVASPTA